MNHKRNWKIIAFIQIATILIISLRQGLQVPTFHLDGAFQNASSQFRLLAGDLPGRDFFPYLGIGPIFSIFPFFIIFGSNLSATVIASHFVVLITLVVSSGLITYLIAESNRKKHALLISFSTLALYILSLVVPDVLKIPGYAAIPLMAEPLNSLRPVRAFLPYLMVVIFLVVMKIAKFQSKRVEILAAAAGAICVIWSNDYALSTLLLILLIALYLLVREKRIGNKKILSPLIPVIIFIFTGALVYTMSTGLAPLNMIQFNFIDVAKDQFWYFGPWKEGSRIIDFPSLMEALWAERVIYPLTVLIVSTYQAARKKSANLGLNSFLGVSTFLGGLVASVGGHLAGYFIPFTYWAIITILAACTSFIANYWMKIRQIDIFVDKNILHNLLVIAGAITIVLSSYWTWDTFRDLNQNKEMTFSKTFGGFISKEINHDIIAKNDSKTLEEYYGLYSVYSNRIPELPIDAVIHALGSKRQIVQTELSHYDQIVTTNPRLSNWEGWNLSANWWFLGPVIKNFQITSETKNTLTWTRGESEIKTRDAECSINSDGATINIENSSAGLFEIELTTDFSRLGNRNFVMIQNNLNFAADAEGFVALNPYESRHVFPAYIREGGDTELKTTVLKPTFDNFRLVSCKSRKLLLDSSVLELYTRTIRD